MGVNQSQSGRSTWEDGDERHAPAALTPHKTPATRASLDVFKGNWAPAGIRTPAPPSSSLVPYAHYAMPTPGSNRNTIIQAKVD